MISAQYSLFVFQIVALANILQTQLVTACFIQFERLKRGFSIEFGVFVCVRSAFTEYLECSHHTVRRRCGDDTARFTKEFLDRMSTSLLKVSITSSCIIFFIGTKSMC